MHANSHDDMETWCNLCEMGFGGVHEFFLHRARAHSEVKRKETGDENEEQKEYECTICDHVFMVR